jgi:phenylpyruvate tautomerase PptA (4-oxalocrotonate tautomerase family)
MPIVDVERVLAVGMDPSPPGLAAALADAAAQVFASPPGRTWVRLRALDAAAYAENDTPPLDADALPVFVTVLHAHPPPGDALAAQVRALTEALTGVLAIDAARVHVQIAPPGGGRQAFGGTLVE